MEWSVLPFTNHTTTLSDDALTSLTSVSWRGWEVTEVVCKLSAGPREGEADCDVLAILTS